MGVHAGNGSDIHCKYLLLIVGVVIVKCGI